MLIKFKSILENYNLHPKGVIHVGAHYGEEAQDYFDYGVKKTIWVEADETHIPILTNNVSRIGFDEYYIYNACLTDEEGDLVEFKVSNNEGQSSSIMNFQHHRIAHPEVDFVRTIQVKTNTLDKLLKKQNGLKDYTFLNADIQGAELLMLHGATKIIKNLNCIYLEVNEKELYEGCALVEEIDSYLELFGFERKETEWCSNFGWGDAVYIKK